MKHTLAERGLNNSFYKFEMVGFNEVYVHDNERKEAFFVDRTFGAILRKTELERITTFESFKAFSSLIFTAMVSSGDGMVGTMEDATLNYELDIRTIALGRNEFAN